MGCFSCYGFEKEEDENKNILELKPRNSSQRELHKYGTSGEKDEDYDTWSKDMKQDLPELSETVSWNTFICTNILVVLTYTGYVGASVSSQLTHANVFQINCIRYIIMAVVAIILANCFRCSLEIKRQHFGTMALCIVLHIFYGTVFYFNASYMPVGNLCGLQSACAAVMATSYDFCKKQISRMSVVSAVLAIIGIILLSQPWREVFNAEYSVIPCEYLENVSQNHTNGSLFDVKAERYGTARNWFENNKNTISYVLIVTGAAMAVTHGALFKVLMKEYPVPPILFWNSIFEGMITIILNLIWSGMFDKPFMSFPASPLCLFLTVLFFTCSAFGNICSYFALQRTFISTLAVVNIFSSVIMYVSQRTFLKHFHPGHANLIEIIGIIVIIFGVSGSRILSYCAVRLQERNKTTT